MTRFVRAVILAAVLSFTCTAPSPAAVPLSPQAYNLCLDGANLIRSGNPELGLDRLNQALYLAPNSWDINFNIALALENLGRKTEAQSWYQKAYQLDPTKALALLGIGRIYFEEKNYQAAIPVLENLARQQEDSATAYSVALSLAKSYAETGRFSDFKLAMNKALSIRENDPASWRFAAQEMDYLKQYEEASFYYKEYLKRFPQASDKVDMAKRLNVVSFGALQQNELKEVQNGFTLNSDTEDLETFVQFLDPEHKNVSDAEVALLMLGLSEIPRTYRHQLEAAGYKVVLAPTVLDAMPQLAGEAPRGYAAGASWHNSNGTFDRARKLIVVGAKANQPASGGVLKAGPLDETVQHEFGHAYDLYIGRIRLGVDNQDQYPEISHSKKFSEAYDADVQKLDPALKPKLAYYLQPGDAGKEELFAQMFVLLFGHRPEPGSPRESFQIAFPTVLQTMLDARKNDPDYERLRNIYDRRIEENTLTPKERVKEMLQN
ncbi:MAG: tetratricopeptide repeat protein [Candidatus Obscuribacterales bacterium]|nr:tetratricopeptide repeat protein [Candidatus Obscuribacterales bacterium]